MIDALSHLQAEEAAARAQAEAQGREYKPDDEDRYSNQRVLMTNQVALHTRIDQPQLTMPHPPPPPSDEEDEASTAAVRSHAYRRASMSYQTVTPSGTGATPLSSCAVLCLTPLFTPGTHSCHQESAPCSSELCIQPHAAACPEQPG